MQALMATTKPGITRQVTLTSAVGFVMAAAARADAWTWGQLTLLGVATIVGTALSAAGANALNQWMERHRDAAMPRTTNRPLPAGQVSAGGVLAFGAMLCAAGLAVLWGVTGIAPMLVSLACIVSYLVFYTPMKVTTPLATFVGAIPGALPPMIGAAAASGLTGLAALREPAGLVLFTLMFIWQIPHFLAIAWMYKDDYAQGGYAVLPVVDPQGATTAWTVALWTLALIPATLLPATNLQGVVGLPYAIIALVSGLAFGYLALRLILERTRERARVVFFASIAHLPLLLLAMTVEATLRTML
jgi:heme o synthase